MKTKTTITIGIPALNEQDNIKHLLKEILAQKTRGISIEKIIVASDGSTDNTVKKAKSIRSKRILMLDNKTRKGQAARQNQIIKLCNSDILILLNADVKLGGSTFIEKLVKPIVKKDADLTSSRMMPITASTWLEKALETSLNLKDELFLKVKKGHNVYTCHGAARAFSKRLYKKLLFSNSVGEDAWSYFNCVNQGFIYKYVGDATAYIKLPSKLGDHLRQSKRFEHSKNVLTKLHGKEAINKHYSFSKILFLKEVVSAFMSQPVYFLVYLAVAIYVKLSDFSYNSGNLWEMATSSKKLR